MEPNEDEIRFDNELKRIKLKLEHGMEFSKPENDSELPPEIEGKFLDYVSAFEKALENARQTTVGELMGSPVWRPEEEIPDEEIGQALDDAMDLLAEHHLSLTAIHEVSDRELYRFISGEMMEEEIDDMDVPGMMTCFTYEDFHPNHPAEVAYQAKAFMLAFLQKQEEGKWGVETAPELLDDLRLRGFWEGFDYFQDIHIEVAGVRVEGERAWVELNTQFLGSVGGEAVHFSGKAALEFQYETEICWVIHALTLPEPTEYMGE